MDRETTGPTVEEKGRHYQRPDVVRDYDRWRFGSAGGKYVNERECQAIASSLEGLSPEARILDLPVGTGRVAAHLLNEAGFRAIEGADASEEMLKAAQKNCGSRINLTRQDAFHTSFASESFDAVVSSRFFFHFFDLKPLITEFTRVLKPGGVLVFDTLDWSPRAILPPLQKAAGGAVAIHRPEDLRALMQAHGLEFVRRRKILLLPSFAYPFLPAAAVRVCRRIEEWAPEALFSKSVWKFRKKAP